MSEQTVSAKERYTGMSWPFCEPCQRWIGAGRHFCFQHPDAELVNEPLSGIGAIWSFTVSHVPMSDQAPEVPYTTALVATIEGPRVLVHVPSNMVINIGDGVTFVASVGSDGAHTAGQRVLATVNAGQ